MDQIARLIRDPVLIVDGAGVVVELNRQARELIGQVAPTPCTNVFGVDSGYAALLSAASETSDYVSGALSIRKASGEMQRFGARVLTIERGSQFRFAIQLLAVTENAFSTLTQKMHELQQAEFRARQSEARYRLVAANIGDVVFTTDKNGIIDFISPSVKQVTGFDPDTWIGKHHSERIIADRQINYVEYFQQNKPLPTGRDNEFGFQRADGSRGWAQSHPTFIQDEYGNFIGIVSVVRDVTERRAVEDDLRLKTTEAEAASVAKSEFLSNMSHELRTPLTGVLGFAGLLESLPDLPATARTYAKRIATSGETLLAVINDILDFSRLEAGRVDLDPQAFDPGVFLAETVGLVSVQAQQKGLTLTTEIDGPLPAAVLADSARVRQVLLNLLSNAIKFTEAGQVRVTLRYQPEAGGALRLAVTDSGIGIPADQFDRLFQRFSQVDGSNTRQFGGAGLGLAISKAFTELMGGQIGAESREGEGSTFWFTIAAPPAPLVQLEPVASDPLVAAARTRLLVVEDVAMNRELVRSMLLPYGYEITEAASGAEAVKVAMTARFDLILMDLQMPGMDGLAATRAIRATCEPNRLTPIVALSANVLPRHLSECAEAGMDDHIGKPIIPIELLTKIAQWAGGPEGDPAVLSG